MSTFHENLKSSLGVGEIGHFLPYPQFFYGINKLRYQAVDDAVRHQAVDDNLELMWASQRDVLVGIDIYNFTFFVNIIEKSRGEKLDKIDLYRVLQVAFCIPPRQIYMEATDRLDAYELAKRLVRNVIVWREDWEYDHEPSRSA